MFLKKATILAAAVTGATMWAGASDAAVITYNLRTSTSVSAVTANQEITFNVYALVGSNGLTADDTLSVVSLRFISVEGSTPLSGNIISTTKSSSFATGNLGAATTGNGYDANADAEWGGAFPATGTTGYFVASNSTPVTSSTLNGSATEFLLGTLTWKAPATVSGGTTTLYAIPYVRNTTGKGSATFKADGVVSGPTPQETTVANASNANWNPLTLSDWTGPQAPGIGVTITGAPPAVTASVSMTATPTGENVASSDNLWKADGPGNEFVDVINGGPGRYVSEVDNLSGVGKFTSGSVVVNSIGSQGPVLVMLWLDGTTNDISALVNTLDAAGANGGYDIALSNVGSSDALYADIQKLNNDSIQYNAALVGGPFTALVKFNASSATGAFNFDFTGTNVKLDRVAVVPEPASLGLLALGAMGLISRRRKA